MNRIISYVILAVVGFWLLSQTLFIVDQRKYAIVFAFGEVKQVISEPGLYVKLPAPFQNVLTLDKRILTIDSDADRVFTADKNNMLVDAFVKWRISDPKLFYVSFKGGDEQPAQDRMSQIIKAALKNEITKRTVRDVISGERAKVMDGIRKKVEDEARKVGIEIVDVRLKRVDYDEKNNGSVYDRMKAERNRVANELRSTGSAESTKIRADADKQRSVIIAEAYRDAEKMRGEGDAKASQIYAQAFGQNPEFYKFYRSLEAYRASFKNRNDVMVVDPNSEFFKYFKNPSATGPKK